jgi:ferredoxin-thioredoxin reductase catalytic subunit
VYAEPDIEEYGQCYCNLYVHHDYVSGKRELQHVPERRPPEKFCL